MTEKNAASIIADYIKRGWKLTSYSCPSCGSPIVHKDYDYYCPVCNKKILVAKDEEEAWEVIKRTVIDNLEKKIVSRINTLVESDSFNDEDLDLLLKYLAVLKEIKALKI